MNALQVVKALETSQDFQSWKSSNANAYLTSLFSIFAEGQKKTWLISYYDSQTQKITTFSDKRDKATEEAFSKDKTILRLGLEEVKIDENTAVNAAKQACEKNYGKNSNEKIVLVLQKLDNEVLWNITFITAAFKIINVKISAVTGKALSHKMSVISDFMQKS